jgi:predicted  nucleic acid-binding Zn-ribbon protein
MSYPSLQRLWRLHEIDVALVEIRKRAAALDPGKALTNEINALESQLNSDGGSAKSLHAEQTDLELKQKGIDEKIKKIETDLFSGKIVNPREVEAYEKEIDMFKRQRSSMDERLMELFDLVPPATAVADGIKKRVDAKKAELADYQKRVVKEQERLKSEFARLNGLRPAATQDIEPGMLVRYEAIRQRHGGVGMSKITKISTCEMCGMKLPVKSIEGVKDGRLVTCEACHRILYSTEGLI